MEPANVRDNVRLLRAEEAVRTLVPRQLAALILEVYLQIVLPVEDVGAIRAEKLDFMP